MTIRAAAMAAWIALLKFCNCARLCLASVCSIGGAPRRPGLRLHPCPRKSATANAWRHWVAAQCYWPLSISHKRLLVLLWRYRHKLIEVCLRHHARFNRSINNLLRPLRRHLLCACTRREGCWRICHTQFFLHSADMVLLIRRKWPSVIRGNGASPNLPVRTGLVGVCGAAVCGRGRRSARRSRHRRRCVEYWWGLLWVKAADGDRPRVAAYIDFQTSYWRCVFFLLNNCSVCTITACNAWG